MAEYSRMAKGSYTVSGGTLGVSAPSVKMIPLPFQPDFVQLINLTQAVTPAQHGIPFAYWDSKAFVSTGGNNYDTIVQIFNSTPVLTTDSVKQGNGISVFSGGLSQQFGTTFTVTGITAANPAVVTTSAPHGYAVGDTVIMQGIATGVTNNAMRLLNGVPFTITAVGSTTTFTIKWNASGGNYANSGFTSASLVKKVLYPFLYLPEDNVISAITLGSTTTVATTMYHNFEVGQEIAFRIPAINSSFWGTTQLNSLPNNVTPGSPVYAYVTSITDNWTFVCNVNSSAYTAFNNNPSSVPTSLNYPQVLAVGDVNTGGNLITASTSLYPPPQFPTSTNRVGTINGPAIRGAFVNNTSQGFIIGAGASKNDTSSWVGGSDGDIMEWRAYLHDYSNP